MTWPTYLERADPRVAPAKLLALGFARGLLMEFEFASNLPELASSSGPAAFAASFFFNFLKALSFARSRALVLLMILIAFVSESLFF